MNEANQAAEQILYIVPRVMRSVAAELRSSGQTLNPAQFAVFGTLDETGSCSLKELAEHMAVSAPTMSNIVSRMVGNGWVERKRSETDRRVVEIFLTPAGNKMLAQIHQHALSTVREALLPLSKTDLHKLLDGLTVLNETFQVPPFDGGAS